MTQSQETRQHPDKMQDKTDSKMEQNSLTKPCEDCAGAAMGALARALGSLAGTAIRLEWSGIDDGTTTEGLERKGREE